MFQLFDFVWQNENNDFKPYLKLKNSENLEISRLTLGKELQNLNYKLSKKKYCIGYQSGSKLIKCINNYSNEIGFSLWKPYEIQCFQCEKAQGFKSAFFFGEDPNEEMKKHLSQTHYIYLAYFYPDIIKVGTAASSREGVRLIEQDALLYAYIAESDGFNIQKLEKAISKEIQITQTVRSSIKFKNLQNKPDSKRAQELLNSKISQVLDNFGESEYKDCFYKKDKIKIINLIDNNHIYYPENKVNLLEPVFFNELDFIPIVGKYLGLRGRFLLFENNLEIFALDTRFVTGRIIDYIDEFVYQEPREQLDLI